MTTGELFEELFLADHNRVMVAARHPDPRVRHFAAPYAGRDDLRFMLCDPEPEVAAASAIAERERPWRRPTCPIDTAMQSAAAPPGRTAPGSACRVGRPTRRRPRPCITPMHGDDWWPSAILTRTRR
nr:hypothetical protein GCM10020063_038130 [Dactylosporangium thailandense]